MLAHVTAARHKGSPRATRYLTFPHDEGVHTSCMIGITTGLRSKFFLKKRRNETLTSS